MFACIKPSSARNPSNRWKWPAKSRTRSSPAAAAGAISPASRFRSFTGKSPEKKKYRIVAVEPSACPSLTKGELRYDFGDTAQTTPLLMMYTLGHDFMPPSIHAGGLRYHGMSPMVSHALKLGLIEAEAYHQTKVFEAGTLFARSEGHCARAGIRACHCRRRQRGGQGTRGGQEARHSFQSVRPRVA